LIAEHETAVTKLKVIPPARDEHLTGHHAIDTHTLHGYLPARGRNAEEFAAMSSMPRAKYLVPFPHHLLNHPTNVGKRSAKRGDQLFKTFAPLLLARERVEFHEIKGHEIVHPLEPTLINLMTSSTKLLTSALFSAAAMGFSPFQRTSGTLSTV
jgi:hypothetical protein